MSERRTSRLTVRLARALEPFILLGLCAVSCEASDAPRDAAGRGRTEAPPREVAEPTRGRSAPPVEAAAADADGDLRELGFETGGRIADVRVEEGDRIRRGQVLASIETGEVDAEVAQAEARLSNVVHQAERMPALRTSSAVALPRFAEAMQAVIAGGAAVRHARDVRARARLVSPVDGVVVRRLADPDEVIRPGLPVLVVQPV